MVWYDVVRYGVVWYGTVDYCLVWYGVSQSSGGVVKGGRLDGAADPSGRPPITSVTGQVPLREIAVDPIILQLVPISPSLNRALMCKIFGPFGRHEG